MPLTVLEPQRTLVALAALAAALLWLERVLAPALLAGVLAGCVVLCLWNLAVRGGAGEGSGEEAAPVGYANGLALLGVVAILLAAGLALEARPPLRVALLASCAPAVAVLWLSESRGAWLALAAGAAAGVATRVPRAGAWLPAALVALGIAAAVAASLARSDERREYWRAAVEAWRAGPALGSGAGTWERSWLELRDVAFPARDAHSLYVEALSELGPLALVLLVALLAPPLLAAGRVRGSPGVAAGTAAFAAVAVHLAVDWDWELPAVLLAGLLPGAALLAASRGGGVVAVPRAAVLVPAALLAAATVPLLAGNVALSQAGESLRAGDAARAIAQARRAGRLQPWAAEPRRLLAEGELERGDRVAAERAVAAAVERDGDDVEVWRTAARVREGTGRRRAEARTRELDPRGSAAGGGAAAPA